MKSTGALTAMCTALIAMVAYLGVHEHQLANDVAELRAALLQSGTTDSAGGMSSHLHKRQLVLTGVNSTGASTPSVPPPPPSSASPSVPAPASAPVSSVASNASAAAYPSVLLQQSVVSPEGWSNTCKPGLTAMHAFSHASPQCAAP